MSREQPDNEGDQGNLVNLPPRKAKTKKTIKFSTSNEMESCEICGNMFKKRGLKIHQTKSGCKSIIENRIKSKSMNGGSQESHHRGSTKKQICDIPTLQSDTTKEEKQPVKKKVNQSNSPHQPEEAEVMVVKKKGPVPIKKKALENKSESHSKKCVSAKEKSTKNIDIRQFGFSNTKKSDKRQIKQNAASEEKEAKTKQTLLSYQHSVIKDTQKLPPKSPPKKAKPPTKENIPSDENSTSKDNSAKSQNLKPPPHVRSHSEREKSSAKVQITTEQEKQQNEEKVKTSTNQQDIRKWANRNEPTNNMKETYKKLAKEVNSGPPDDILSKHKYQMKRRDYRSLTGTNYLNDQIINEYCNLIKERNENQGLAKIVTLDTHDFPRLEHNFEEAFEIIAQRLIETDLNEIEKIIIPIHKEDHWSLIVVIIKDQKIEYYDSILGSRRSSTAPKRFKRFFDRYLELHGKEGAFKTCIMNEAPLQTNSYDCGVFACQNAEKAARGVPITRQEDTTVARKKMMVEIFQGKLTSEEEPNLKELLEKASIQQQPKKKKTKTERSSKASITKDSTKVKENTGRMQPINWPKANSKQWAQLDADITGLLETIYSPPDKKAVSHPKIIYQMCKERFGLKERKETKKQSGPSRRQKKCAKLRQEIKLLKKAYNNAPEEEKEAINELNKEKIRSLRLAKRAESLKKNRKKFARNCQEFLSQPYQFARKILRPKPSGCLESCQKSVEEHLKHAHSNPGKSTEREPHPDLKHYPEPEYLFNDEPPSFKEFTDKLRKTRSKSSPGPNGVPYLLYKRCPGVAKQLWFYLRELWKRNTISDAWREAEGVFIPKEEGAKTVDKFRTISLLNVEGKLFLAMKAERITKFLLQNSYIDPSIQKGGIPGVSGCLEHTAVLSQLIREAIKEKKNLVITWLDIANAYGSIPHDVIKLALRRAHIPEKTQELIESYYNDVKIRFTTKNFTTSWQQVEKGIITGCTLSVVLFALTMSWLVESVKKETKGPVTSSGQRQANSRLFMDDITTATETLPQTNSLLKKLSAILKWAGLGLKPVKCRLLAIYKGEIQQRQIKMDGKAIPTVQEMPIRYLGKLYNSDHKEQQQIKDIENQLKHDLKKIEQCKLPGRYKAWIVQNMLIHLMMWPLNIYNIPESKVENLQRNITVKLKEWLQIPRSFSANCLYSKSTKLRLPYSSLLEEFKISKARSLVTLQESADLCISNASIKVDGGRKANTAEEINIAKARLQMKEITGIANRGREGLGMRRRNYYSTSSKKAQRDLVVETLREKEEEQRVAKMTSLCKQGANLKWEVPQRYLKQRDIIKMPDAKLSFLIKSVFDLLPTPANKNKWFNTEEKCKLCGQEGTLNHILTGCKTALTQGRYKWRHDKVLRELALCIQKRISENKSANQPRTTGITFIKEGGKKQSFEPSLQHDYLSSAKDWAMAVDMEGRLKIPEEVTCTSLRPDITLISRATRQFSMIELTVPSEERIEVSGELKRLEYEKIAQEARLNNWRVKIWAVEVGCRGFPAASLLSLLKEIGYKGGQRNKAIDAISKPAEYASKSLWKISFYIEWGRKKE